jgi:hypothetical protein
MVACAAQQHQDACELHELVVQHMQQRLTRACAEWTSRHACQQGSSCSTQEVHYVGLDCRGKLQVPTVCCSNPSCSAAFTPSAIQAGCFPSTAVDAHAWYGLDVHRAYQQLQLHEGLSATGEPVSRGC